MNDTENNQESRENDADFEYECAMALFEIEQAFLDATFDDDGNEVEPE